MRRGVRNMDFITDFVKGFVKGYNNKTGGTKSQELDKNPENQIFCQFCGIRLIQNSSYCPECKTILPLTGEARRKQEKFQNLVKQQLDKARENISKLRESGNLILIDNYVKKYPKHTKGTVNFENIKELLKTKQFSFTNEDLETIIRLRHSNHTYKEVKTKVLANNPINVDECLRNYLTLLSGEINESMIRQILIDQFNYDGDIVKDLARIRIEMVREKSENEIKKFESDLMADGQKYGQITIRDIDTISGYDFELVLERLFEGMDYQVKHTSLSNDQGADLIIEKDGTRSVVQAKNWTANVGNSAIQEVVAAIKHYQANRALVISSSGFTQSAIDLARSNKVELWDRTKLSTILNDNPIRKG